jgi:hypothetical protein
MMAMRYLSGRVASSWSISDSRFPHEPGSAVLVMRDDPPAHAPDHRAVSLHESGKRVFVLVLDELIQQLAVAYAGFIGKGRLAEILENLSKPVNRHVHHPRAEIASYILLPRRARFLCFLGDKLGTALPLRTQSAYNSNEGLKRFSPHEFQGLQRIIDVGATISKCRYSG